MYLTPEQSEKSSIVVPILQKILDTRQTIVYKKMASANAYVFNVGEEYIKIPTTVHAKRALKKEISISNFLSQRVSFSVPYFEYGKICVEVDGVEGNVFFSKSRKIKGIPLAQSAVREISCNMFVCSLVDVLDELHSLLLDKDNPLRVPTFEDRLNKIVDATVCSDVNVSDFKTDVVKRICARLGGGDSHVLCHRDLHGANVFVNPQIGAVTGLLDFGMAEWAPPAVEMADIGVYAGVGLASKIMQFYRIKTGRSLGDLYLYHAGDRNRWLQKLIVSYAQEQNIPVKVASQCVVGAQKKERVK